MGYIVIQKAFNSILIHVFLKILKNPEGLDSS